MFFLVLKNRCMQKGFIFVKRDYRPTRMAQKSFEKTWNNASKITIAIPWEMKKITENSFQHLRTGDLGDQ